MIFRLFTVVSQNTVNNVLPILGAFALGSQKLLPALQQIYSNWSALKAYGAAVTGMLNMLNQPDPHISHEIEPFNFNNSIVLKSVDFSYGIQNSYTLKNINLQIGIGETIGLIGETGSGKSTLADILMGLLRPSSGQILVDGKNLYDSDCPTIVSWTKSIAHVPQDIYLQMHLLPKILRLA